ncbi:subclass B3 metallo-beta-lactamase [Dyella psychrodurans]|uniref:beta-lactamase n=1 Tax=Dyella psychrodurans TaxID=1927960 RepID=A0A370X201_9GAMM|nr:subclass B3 metallo-beta-lactamase [Dyella psychrodurans]RDS82396.1 subclass B3 metallo-beta-lactamase [Dyella psychrodurans]
MSIRLSLSIALTCCLVLPPAHAQDRAAWNAPQKPFRIFGNTYYVGPHGLSSILVKTSQGLVLIDGDLPESTPLIEANIRELGFRISDVRWILNSHAHSDHAGGIAELQRASGAQVLASAAGAHAMELGGADPNDPQYGTAPTYPPVHHVRVVADGETLHLGDVDITAHYTPGHTPGSTSWTWRTCEGGTCLNIAYADSLTAISNPHYRFTDAAAHPHRVEDFRRAIATVAALPCDILLTPHPGASDFWERMKRREAGTQPDPLVDQNACKAYAATAEKDLDARLDKERASQP